MIRELANEDWRIATIAMVLVDLDRTRGVRSLINRLRRLDVDYPAEITDSADRLTKSRVSSTRRSSIAVAFYVIAAFSSLASGLAQGSITPYTPHTIALRELYYWLITAVALSAALGAYPHEKTAEINLRFVLEHLNNRSLGPPELVAGGCHTFSPVKSVENTRQVVKTWGISALAVIGAFTFSFAMSWITPTQGIGCRSLLEMGYVVAWLLNFGLSNLFTHWTGRWCSWLHLVDIVIAIPQILCLFLAFRGWFNSCKCWAAVWTFRSVNWVPGNIQAREFELAGAYYGLIGGALALQVIVSSWIFWHYRHELRVLYGRCGTESTR